MNKEVSAPRRTPQAGDFLGWRVIVTGGSSGIGLATGQRFVDRGAKVVSLDLTRPDDAEAIAAAICYLAGPDARSTTGADLVVDGEFLERESARCDGECSTVTRYGFERQRTDLHVVALLNVLRNQGKR